ncbi:hypothetical protein TESG_00577 [Trichophyton tonsurans CBS 112818]|uniref:Ca3427-like PBP 2 domain-containing protein n=2 Tax=Trichophyton TaxID=5550 RepID=F2PS05_TRIEC|nr:hypothetical protein TESG_00577 [Trichophyton tonsurans CBS 112818]EGE04673.1 hypothetical protein TEQG_03540 [Trichophyton equinum CBS 127.97]
MASEPSTIRIGYVPEHYLAPLHLAIRSSEASSLPFKISLISFPSGTGHMITSLRQNEIDVAIGLTEGWVAGLVGKPQLEKGEKDGGYKLVGQWVETPLRWAIVTGHDRKDIQSVNDLKGGRVGVSRLGSGSHIMSFVLAQQQSWPSSSPLTPTILGPFPSLRDGVTGSNPEQPDAQPSPTADFFMWEQFTTKPYFEPTTAFPKPPLKKIGEIYTPWPSWQIAASTRTFPSPESDSRLTQLFSLLDSGISTFQTESEKVVQQLGTGEFGCTYSESDAKEWLKDVRFVKGSTRGADKRVIEGVVTVLKTAGVVPEDISNDEAVNRVIGIQASQ